MAVDVEINIGGIDGLRSLLEDAFAEANEVLGRQFQQEIYDDKWDWPVGESPRDIVDTSQLANSYRSDVSPAVTVHSWPVAHAMAVHEGYTTRGGSVMPGRPWTEEPLAKLSETYATIARQKLGDE